MQYRKNCCFKEVVLLPLLKSDAVLFLRSTGSNDGQATSPYRPALEGKRKPYTFKTRCVRFICRGGGRGGEVSGHAPFRRSLRSVKYAKRFQTEHMKCMSSKNWTDEYCAGVGGHTRILLQLQVDWILQCIFFCCIYFPASCATVTGSFPGVKSGRGVTLILIPFCCRGQERVELYFYSPYGPYGLYRASVPVQGCTIYSPTKFQNW
jgi:hypothetical protein